MMRHIRLLWHIFPAILLITLLSMGLVTWYGTYAIKQFYYQEMTHNIENRARLMQPEINRLLTQSPEQLQTFCRRVGRSASTRITLIADKGQVLADSNESPDSMDNHSNRPEIVRGFEGEVGSSIRYSKTLGHNRLYVALPAVEHAQGQKTVLRLSLPVSAVDEALAVIHQKIFFGIAAVVLLATMAAYYVAGRISFPIATLQKEAEKLADGALLRPIHFSDFQVSTEMASLTSSFNTMVGEVQGRMHIISRKNNELEAVFSSMADPVLAIDTEEQIIRINRAAATLFNLEPAKVTGQSFSGLIRNREIQDLAALVLENGDVVQEEVSLFEGIREKQLRVRVTPLLDATDNSIGALIVMSDISRLHRLENLRRDFVANVSHELKTPITSIKGYVETLLDDLPDEMEGRPFLEIVSRQTSRLEAIVDDLLTLSRLEDRDRKDSIELARQPVSPALETAAQTCGLAAQEKNIIIEIDCPEKLQAVVNLPLLEQALINLLGNGITYSPPDSTILIQAETQAKNDQRTVSIHVRDQGPGIGAKHLDRIFERFYRCDRSRSRKNGGTGLGLAIVKHIAQSHGGSVEVVSAPGRGSTFTLTLQG